MDDAELKRAAELALTKPYVCTDEYSAMRKAWETFEANMGPGRYLSLLSRLSAAEARVGVLEEALREARSSVEAWGAYAAPYFAEKHDLAGDLARIDAALAQEPTP